MTVYTKFTRPVIADCKQRAAWQPHTAQVCVTVCVHFSVSVLWVKGEIRRVCWEQQLHFDSVSQLNGVCVCVCIWPTLVLDAAPGSVVCPDPGSQHFWRSRPIWQHWSASYWRHSWSRTGSWTPSPLLDHGHWADLGKKIKKINKHIAINQPSRPCYIRTKTFWKSEGPFGSSSNS